MTASASPAFATSHLRAEPSRDRRALSVDEILRWTIRDELPKSYRTERLFDTGSSVLPMWRYAVLGTTIDCSSREPGMPAAMGDPHPDALVVEQAIGDLGRAVKAADEGTGPLPFDLTPYRIGHGLGSDVPLPQIMARAIMSVVPWLVTIAKRGGCPDIGEGISVRAALNAQGSVTVWETVEEVVGHEADGTPWITRSDRVAVMVRPGTAGPRPRLYPDGAFCKLKYDRTPADVADDRAIYASWHAGLTWLHERLSDGTYPLASLKPKPPTAPMSPWIVEPTPPRVLTVVGRNAVDPDVAEPVERDTRARRVPAPVRRGEPADYPIAA